ncbi:MAG: glycerate kinase [Desulfurococcaceae archaeon]
MGEVIKNADTLRRSDLHGLLIEAVECALRVADPYGAVTSHLGVKGGELLVGNRRIDVKGSVHVVGFGKASRRMAEAVLNVLGDRVAGGVVVHPGERGRVGPIEVLEGDHPLPGLNTLKSSQRLLEYLEHVSERDILLVLVSGGGSALFEIPEEGVTLEDVAWITRELMRRGVGIYELNTVRKRLSRVKGGKLLRYINASRVVSLIVSDVIGDRVDVVASGPTAPDETSFADAYSVLERSGLLGSLPRHVRELLERGVRGEVPDTPKPGDPCFSKVDNVVILSNQAVLEALSRVLSARGFNVLVLTSMLEGEAREVGRVLASIIRNVHKYGKPVPKPAAILAGGETVVTVRGSGIGGRNQELCLSLAMGISDLPDTVAACVATDGIDGVSPAAGALVDGKTVEKALTMGLNPINYLENNDSYTFFYRLGQVIVTGYTETNVNDLFISLIK